MLLLFIVQLFILGLPFRGWNFLLHVFNLRKNVFDLGIKFANSKLQRAISSQFQTRQCFYIETSGNKVATSNKRDKIKQKLVLLSVSTSILLPVMSLLYYQLVRIQITSEVGKCSRMDIKVHSFVGQLPNFFLVLVKNGISVFLLPHSAMHSQTLLVTLA